jgi:uncharacterized protein (DUF2126 family)
LPVWHRQAIDGRHTGPAAAITWCWVVDGGGRPFLRRPDLLKSVILYWQRHPSFYLFGVAHRSDQPGSARDEARHDQFYELEIALATVLLPGEGEPPRPWLVDRLFRNLLVDVTGNTHRAEVCIDAAHLTARRWLGLVEFRSLKCRLTRG